MNEFTLGNLGKAPLQNSLAQKAESLARGAAGKDVLERKRAAQEFTSFLYLEVLKAMRATLPKDGLFENDSLSRDIYSSMFDTEVARILAKRDATGFTQTVERAIDAMVPSPRAEAAVGAPVDGVVSSGFGMRHDPIRGGEHFHGGVDIAAPAGAEVKAPSGGKVTFSGPAKGYGNLVQIDHGEGMVTRYAHNDTNLVSAGDEVRPGQTIAIVGSTGRATGAHLHFEVRQGGKPVDPSVIIGGKVKGTKVRSIV
ncbi:MAG TPA: peptidoglycan DD-metalloendopeptidase family protein [Candidatus Binatia bacterium]|jgi:murein DD-endopeptidase MepM/ murein hydrolase activator NlpD